MLLKIDVIDSNKTQLPKPRSVVVVFNLIYFRDNAI